MIGIIVRSKRDADAVKAMAKTFYSEWDLEIYTLHGARSLDRALDELENILTDDMFYVILLGRDDRELANELIKYLPPNTTVHLVPRARIRNTRIEHLAYEFSIARSRLRLSIRWFSGENTYVLNRYLGEELERYEVNPAYDIFLGLGDGTYDVLRSIFGGELCRNPLIQRRFGGEHYVYCGGELVGILNVPDEGFKPYGKLLRKPLINEIDLDILLKTNASILDLFERISVDFMEKYRDWADTVIVPWSGGKDSTVALLLALKVYPRKKIHVVNVDTGVEFPWTLEYIDKLSKHLGISVYRVYAGIDKAIIVDGKPMPTHDNRWCTGLKIEAIEKAIKELAHGNTLVVTGDRDAESRSRSLRSPSRDTSLNIKTISPIKLWGTIHTQLYMLWKNIPLNPLYLHGFYRIGCYICPALRSLEKYIILHNTGLYTILKTLPLFRQYVSSEKHK